MRPQSPVQIDIKGKCIGGPRPLICLPLLADTQVSLLEQAADIPTLRPDLIEWRVDALATLTDARSVARTLAALHAMSNAWPLLFTCRTPAEGGMQALSTATRVPLYQMAITSEKVDMIDIELSSGQHTIQALRSVCRPAGVKLILSYHDFEHTPDSNALVQKLLEAEQAGADIAKVAVMPRDTQDVLTLLNATHLARQQLKIPLIAISMGHMGVITRIAGGLFGSDITFASGTATTAPGQLPIMDLHKAWSVLSW
ncbi:MAG: type I 3-dehydroquinate dehydratase [Desulfobacteraceae bacterium]|jgi:3-dehydroquinate dehydratase-1|nr:type I 3-dehydroquinate dehydratase [Desulfobacteraceae bacterium]